MVLVCHFLAYTPPSVLGNTVGILDRWRRPVALCEALDPLNWSVLAVLCRRISLAVKMGRIGMLLFVADNFTINIKT